MRARDRMTRWIMISGLVTAAALLDSCGGAVEPKIVAGIDGCSRCGMVIDQPNQACGWIVDGGFVPFDSPACLLAELDDLRRSGQPPPQEIFFADYRNGELVAADTAAFLLTDHVPTVMNGRVLCFATAAEAAAAKRHDDEMLTDWTGYRRLRGEPDVVIKTAFDADGMRPDVVVASKGDLVLWRAMGEGLDEDLQWVIKGYEEVGPVVVRADGEAVEVRFFAIRPGAGFPIENADSGETLGMLKVSGPHTSDEAAR